MLLVPSIACESLGLIPFDCFTASDTRVSSPSPRLYLDSSVLAMLKWVLFHECL